MEDFVRADGLEPLTEGSGGTEAGIGFIADVRHNGDKIGEDGMELFEGFENGSKGAERAAHGKADDRMFHKTSGWDR